MLLSFLQTNKISYFLLLPVIAGVLWFQSFYFNPVIVEFPFSGHEMPLYFVIYKWLAAYPILLFVTGYSLVMFIAFLITRLNKKYMIIVKRTYLLPLFLIVLSGFYIPTQFFHPGLPASIFVFLAIDSLFGSYKKESGLSNLFNASIYIAIGSLFYFNLIYMIVVLWAGMIILQPFSIKEVFKTFVGAIIPYFFCWTYYFLTDNTSQFIKNIGANFESFERSLFFDLPYYVFFLFLFLFIIIASMKLIGDFSRLKTSTRKYFVILFWVFLISVLLFIISPMVFMEMMPIISIPLSFLLTYYLINTRSYWLGNIIVVVAILLLIGIQIFPFLI